MEALQKIQDGFSEYTGMAALTTDSNGVPVTKGSGFTRFCMELTRRSADGCRSCEECDRNGAFLTLKNKCATVYDCHAGLTDFAAPIMLEGKVIGSFIGGQVRTAPVCEEKLREVAVRYGINPDEYVEAAKSTKCLSKEEVKKAAEYLVKIAEGLSGMAYKHYLSLQESEYAESVAKSHAEFVMHRSLSIKENMDHWIGLIRDKLESLDGNSEFLANLLSDAVVIHNVISDSVEFIETKLNNVELKETFYKIQDMKNLIGHGLDKISEGKNIPLEISADENYIEELYGDMSRIVHILNRTAKEILLKKTGGELKIRISTESFSYATMLSVSITDTKTVYTEKEVQNFREIFTDLDMQKITEKDEYELFLSMENHFLKRCGGSISFRLENDSFIVNVKIPQLGRVKS